MWDGKISGELCFVNSNRRIMKAIFGLALLFIAACSSDNSPTITSFQNADNNIVTNERVVRTLDCNKSNEYVFKVVENVNRKIDNEPFVPKDLNILVGEEVAGTIQLPISDYEVKNFSLNSAQKTKSGFEVNVEWGGGLYHYEIQFDFRCKDNNFYLYKVRNDNFSTTNPDSGNFWDKKETKITNIKPVLPINKFVMLDYLQ